MIMNMNVGECLQSDGTVRHCNHVHMCLCSCSRCIALFLVGQNVTVPELFGMLLDSSGTHLPGNHSPSPKLHVFQPRELGVPQQALLVFQRPCDAANSLLMNG